MQRLSSIVRQTVVPRPTLSPRAPLRAASTMPAKHEWLVILPDQAGSLERRLKVRNDHLTNVKPGFESGFFKLGGAIFDKPIVEGETPAFAGSVIIAEATTKEEVVEVLKRDVYTQSEVWDWDKVTIYPFKSAMRTAT